MVDYVLGIAMYTRRGAVNPPPPKDSSASTPAVEDEKIDMYCNFFFIVSFSVLYYFVQNASLNVGFAHNIED